MSDIIQVNPLVFGGEGEAVHANMFVKLWENPNPSASFGPQTITLASDDYDFTLTIARRVAAYQQDICAITPKGDTVVINVGVAGGSGVTCAWRRLDYVSDTSLSAIDCKTATGTGAATTDNTQLIPIAIYGFKKSLDITAIVSEVSTDATKCILSDNVTNVDDAIKKRTLKFDTFSGTTDGSGNVKIANNSDNRVVVSVMLDQAAINFPFIYTNGHTYIHVMAENGSAKTSTAVSGTYYYLDK